MKTLLQLIFTALLIQLNAPVAAQVFTENFDGGSVNMVSSGTPGFNVTNLYSQSAPNSILGGYSNNSTSTLTTPSFSTLGNNFVTFDFDHICKTALNDTCIIELSVNGGLTWSKVNAATCNYLGSSNAFIALKRFFIFSYSAWTSGGPGNVNNSWWEHESFDISNLCANQDSVMIRFVMKDNINNDGMEGYYGWLIDNITISASPCELQPPVITPSITPVSGNVFDNGPYYVADSITDWSGVSAQLFYTVNNGSLQSINMSPTIYPINEAYIPAMNDGDTVCWYVVATDPCGNTAQYPATVDCFVVLPNIGLPYCDNFDGGAPAWTPSSFIGLSQWQLGTPSLAPPILLIPVQMPGI